MALDWSFNFKAKCLSGCVRYEIVPHGVQELRLDVKHQTVLRVTVAKMKEGVSERHAIYQPTTWTVECGRENDLGDALVIAIGKGRQVVKVCYATTKKSTALQWCQASRTQFVYSFSANIRSREFFPCQDTPAVKMPFTAIVRTPRRNDRVLMSATRVREHMTSAGLRTVFTQPKPVPAYLVGVAVGPWELQRVGRACVWGIRKYGMDTTCRALLNIDEDLALAETLVGPLPWPTLEYLHLPTSKDHGFEYPGLTILSQTVDPYPNRRQLALHELSHQWFGNHVTPARWCDFWLSEGLATFLERKIAANFGKDGKSRVRKNTAKRFLFLKRTINKLQRSGRGREACLCCKVLDQSDPEKVLSESDYLIPYEKGYLLLCQLSNLVGETRLWGFLRRYLKAFGGRCASSEDFAVLWQKVFPKKRVDWHRWLHCSTIPGGPHHLL